MTELLQPQTLAPYQMRRVVLESPFAGRSKFSLVRYFQQRRNIRYARSCIRDSLLRGEAPIASHLLYTQPGVLVDTNKLERCHGINAGHAWLFGDLAGVVVYTDLGISSGMHAGIGSASIHHVPVEYRRLAGWVL